MDLDIIQSTKEGEITQFLCGKFLTCLSMYVCMDECMYVYASKKIVNIWSQTDWEQFFLYLYI